ncbi:MULTISPECIES: endonuclease/exonuclease/phosphatase family protein [unclassified Streptomyces]|uniref:endonuclease/exonuclease/phosphatase family protein n=1 Tax=unclassified Streptomyces TaxID=2593676 RepID=UPI002E28AEE5|nr:endonuclease/exonuclease/phosphatase family protein [Streptomyces sp. NBC_00223]
MTSDQLSLLDPDPAVEAPRHQAATDAARLVVFNAQHASPARARRQAAWLADQETADLVIITEVGPGPGGDALVAALADRGYAHVQAPEPRRRDYRTVLASRTAPLKPVLSGVSVLPHRAPCAEVLIGGQRMVLLGLYVPSRGPRERRNEDKRAFQESVTAALQGLVAHCGPRPLIVAGDLNVLEPGHIPHYRLFGEWEYDFYRSFTAAGLTDAFRHVAPDAREHSWFGRGGNGYRFDHAFVTTPHRSHVLTCGYLDEPRRLGLTDHSALTLEVARVRSGPTASTPPGREGRL